MNPSSQNQLESHQTKTEEKEPKLLPWTKCWRKIYEGEATALGYICKWGGCSALFVQNKEEKWWALVTPASNPFLMQDVVEAARINAAKQIKENEEREERISLGLSCAAAGVPVFLYKPNRKVKPISGLGLISAALDMTIHSSSLKS